MVSSQRAYPAFTFPSSYDALTVLKHVTTCNSSTKWVVSIYLFVVSMFTAPWFILVRTMDGPCKYSAGNFTRVWAWPCDHQPSVADLFLEHFRQSIMTTNLQKTTTISLTLFFTTACDTDCRISEKESSNGGNHQLRQLFYHLVCILWFSVEIAVRCEVYITC